MAQSLAVASACVPCSAAVLSCHSKPPLCPALRCCTVSRVPKQSLLRTHRFPEKPMASKTSVAAAGSFTSEHILDGADIYQRPDSGQKPLLYTHVLCPYAQRAFLTLLCKGVDHQTIQIDLSQKPGWFTKLCKDEGLPSTVPAVDYKGQAQTDSIGICKWLCKQFDDPKYPELRYKHPKDKQQADQLIQDCAAFSGAGLDLLAGSTGRSWGIGTGQSQGQWKAFEKTLQKFQKAIEQSGGPFLMGSEVSVADLIYMPFMERFAIVMPEFTPYNPTQACDGHIGQWLADMQKLECCQKAAPDAKLFLQALKQERSLDFFDFSTYTAYQLHPHLR